MAKFRYVVVNTENQQLQGSINAPDEKKARSELNDLGFSIISMEKDEGTPKTADDTAIQLPVWEFAGIDKNNKNVAGTIQAEDRYSAYVRLIQEYEFDVDYLIDSTLDEKEKDKSRKKGVYDLADKYNQEFAEAQKESADEKDIKEFEQKQAVLQKQIDFVLDKVRKMLDEYEEAMTPTVKEKIRQKVEKLLRIKSSTNLDYIRKTTQDLLEMLQKEEVFLHKEMHTKDRTKMVVEAKSMMMQLKSSKSKSNMNVTDAVRQWRQENILEKEGKPPFHHAFFDFLAKLVLNIHLENEEIINIKNEISSVNEQMKQYIKLYFEATSPSYKKQIKSGLKKLWRKRGVLKKQLKQAKRQQALARREAGEASPIQKFAEELRGFCGWLLALYLVYYFISVYAVTKDFGIGEVPGLFYIYRSQFLKYFLSTIFLLYASLSIKKQFFPKKDGVNLVITPIFLISILLIYFNF